MSATPLDRLPRVGEVVTVHAVAFGGVNTTGRVVADGDGAPILADWPQGVTLARVETDEGFAEWVPWTDNRAQVEYYLAAESREEVGPEEVAVATEPVRPSPSPRGHRKVTPLTAEELRQEAGVTGRAYPGRNRARAEVRSREGGEEEAQKPTQAQGEILPVAVASLTLPGETWDERAVRLVTVQERRVAQAVAQVNKAAWSVAVAERAYFGNPPDEEQGSLFDAEAGLSPGANSERNLQALLAAQESHRQALAVVRELEKTVPLELVRDITAGWHVPSWAWAIPTALLLVVGGPLVVLLGAVVVGLPVAAFVGAFKR